MHVSTHALGTPNKPPIDFGWRGIGRWGSTLRHMSIHYLPQYQALNAWTGDTVRMRACTHTILLSALRAPARPSSLAVRYGFRPRRLLTLPVRDTYALRAGVLLDSLNASNHVPTRGEHASACLHAYDPTLRLMRTRMPSTMSGAYACKHACTWQSR